MDAVSATTASTTTSSTATSSADATTTTDAGKSFATLFTEAQAGLKTGEKLTQVDNHKFARINGGERDDMCINLSGNARNGQAFDLIWRNGRQFHVYGGSGADHKVVEVGTKAAADTTASADATTPTDTSGGTSATASS
jgi:hypothetical protein